MFDLIPFEHKNNDLFRYLDDMERAFFGGNGYCSLQNRYCR